MTTLVATENRVTRAIDFQPDNNEDGSTPSRAHLRRQTSSAPKVLSRNLPKGTEQQEEPYPGQSVSQPRFESWNHPSTGQKRYLLSQFVRYIYL
jgi:hypothetical protein